MEKIKMLQSKQPPEYTCLDEQRLELNNIMHPVIKEAAYQKAYISHTSLVRIDSNRQLLLSLSATDAEDSILRNRYTNYADKDHPQKGITTPYTAKPGYMLQQNIWSSRVLRNGARDQRWFDKLQDYRNGV